MPQKSVLIIDESAPLRDYLAAKLAEADVVVIKASNGVEGSAKLIHHKPDLVISDYHLAERNLVQVVQTKLSDVSVSSVPVICCTSRLAPEKIEELGRLGVRHVFTKPLKIDELWHVVSQTLKVALPLDESPCILDAHVNENVVFVEVALGFNSEKINLLEYKLQELLALHSLEIPKFLVMFSNLEVKPSDLPKVRRLFEILVGLTRGRVKWVTVLTQSQATETALRSLGGLGEMGITDSLEKAMDQLWDQEKFGTFLQEARPLEGSALAFHFGQDKALEDLSEKLRNQEAHLRIAVVDDDFIVQEIVKNAFAPTGSTVWTFDDGHDFLSDPPAELDLILLDLLMPRVGGFGVLEALAEKGDGTPVIVLSSVSRRDTVLKALGYGIRSYITKPLKPETLLRKAFEVVGSHF